MYLVEYTVGEVWKSKHVRALTAEAAKNWVRLFIRGACNVKAQKIAL